MTSDEADPSEADRNKRSVRTEPNMSSRRNDNYNTVFTGSIMYLDNRPFAG